MDADITRCGISGIAIYETIKPRDGPVSTWETYVSPFTIKIACIAIPLNGMHTFWTNFSHIVLTCAVGKTAFSQEMFSPIQKQLAPSTR